jgi:hypothetical protein
MAHERAKRPAWSRAESYLVGIETSWRNLRIRRVRYVFVAS